MTSPPIADGAIETGDGGRIVAVHSRAPGGAIDLGEAAIVPGFINAHLHLEFSDLKKPFGPPRPFAAWIRALVAYRRRQGDAGTAIRHGLEECRRSGTVAVGEIATQDRHVGEPPSAGPAGVTFREVLGVRSEKIGRQLEIARPFLQGGERTLLPNTARGLSPHAPYSVNPALFQQVVDLAVESGAPLAMHLAETEAELELLRNGSGELVEMLSDFGEWQAGVLPVGTRPLDFLHPLVDVAHVIIAHGNYLDETEIDFIAGRPNFALVYCPRTHFYFGHTEHPWRKAAARGGLVAIGTDGRSSNPDLSVWNELAFLHRRFPDADPAMLLQMGTLNGARALGLESDLGSLEAGKRTEAAVIRLGARSSQDPYADLFHPLSKVERLLID